MPVISRMGVLGETTGLANPADPFILYRVGVQVYATCNPLDGSQFDGVARNLAACLDRFRANGSENNETLWQNTITTVDQRKAFKEIIQEFKVPNQDPAFSGDGFDPNGAFDWYVSTYLRAGSETGNFPQMFAKYFISTSFPAAENLRWDSDANGKALIDYSMKWDERVRANANPEMLNPDKSNYKGKTILYTGTADGFVSAEGTRRAFRLAGGANNPNLAFFEIPGMSHCVDLQTASDNPPWYIGGVNLHLKSRNITFVPDSLGLNNTKHDALLALAEWHEKGQAGKRPDTITSTAFSRYGANGRRDIEVKKKRPVCRSPMVQTFNGSDTQADADNESKWTCK